MPSSFLFFVVLSIFLCLERIFVCLDVANNNINQSIKNAWSVLKYKAFKGRQKHAKNKGEKLHIFRLRKSDASVNSELKINAQN